MKTQINKTIEKRLYGISLTLLVLFLFNSCSLTTKKYTSYVNPFIGTGGHGHTYPGAVYPFGFVQLSPDTRIDGWDGCSGYHYSDNRIYGFSHTHLSGTGVSDYGDLLLMPRTGEVIWDNGYNDSTGYFSTFSHKTENAEPGYYSVHLNNYNIDVELTASQHCGVHKYTFNDNSDTHILIDLSHRDSVLESWIKQVSPTEFEGMRRSKAWATNQVVYFVIKLSQPVIKTLSNITKTDSTYSGYNVKLALLVKPKKNIIVKVGLSAVDINGARNNLKKEVLDSTFLLVKTNASKAWEKELSKIEVSGGTPDKITEFYTALYHTMIVPNTFSDIDGRYLGHDGKIHNDSDISQYTVFSLWDTYRATHPLYTIIDKKRSNDFIWSFLRIYQQSGTLPVWELAGNETNCMIGYHAVPIIADAISKKIGTFNKKLALQAMVHSATLNKLGLKSYKKNHVISIEDESESVSKTLEYAYDDWCIYNTAKIFNNKAVEQTFKERALSYRNLFDTSTKFIRPISNGGWVEPFDPKEVNFNYTEANGWQYNFYEPQDINGFINLMGGDKYFSKKLDEMFKTSNKTTGRHQVDITGLIGQYAHGNEPSHHIAYLYAYAGESYKTQQITNQILTQMYSNKPDGLIGNEDCGQMSAWYVFSSIGMYPINPADGTFVFGSPQFKNVTIHLENGKKFIINTKNRNKSNIYINKAELNSKSYEKSFIKYSDILKGGKLTFYMQDTPNKEFGKKSKNRPQSSIECSTFLSNPIINGNGKRSFKKSKTITIINRNSKGKILYTTNNKSPLEYGKQYTKPITIRKTTKIKAVCIDSNRHSSPLVEAKYYRMNENRTITLISKYNPQYSAGGPEALIDHIRGPLNFRTGFWQGYQGQNFEAIVSLKTKKLLTETSLGCLQDMRSWIMMPKKVIFYGSTDSVYWFKLGERKNKIAEKTDTPVIYNFKIRFYPKKLKYVKVKAINYGKLPSWHQGKGGDAFIFTDEITLK